MKVEILKKFLDKVSMHTPKTALSILDYMVIGNGGMFNNTLDVQIQYKNCGIVSGGTYLINRNWIKMIVSEIKKGEIVITNEILDGGINKVTVKTNKGTFVDMHPHSFDDYPTNKGMAFDNVGILKKEDVNTFHKSVKYCADDELRPVMNGVYYSHGNKEIVASDAHTLIHTPTNSDIKGNFIFPKELVKLLDVETDYKMAVYKVGGFVHNSEFTCNEFKITIRNIDGEYPKYQNVIPTHSPHKIIFNKALFLESITTVNKFIAYNNSPSKMFKLIVNGGEAKLLAEDIDYGNSFETKLSCKTDIEGTFKIGLSSTFMHKIISDNTTTNKNVVLYVEKPERCVLIDDNYLLMPMMLS